MRIAIIDDDQVSLKIAANFLRSEGEQLSCYSSAESFQCEKDKNFDLVLCDYDLRTSTGVDVMIDYLEKNPETVFVLITAYWDLDVVVQAWHSGAYDFVKKPVDIDYLELLLSQVEARQPRNEQQFLNQMTRSLKKEERIDKVKFAELKANLEENVFKSALDQTAEELIYGYQSISRSIFSSESQKTTEICHRLIGTVANFGLNRLGEKLEEVQQAVQSGKDVETPYQQLGKELKLTLIALKIMNDEIPSAPKSA